MKHGLKQEIRRGLSILLAASMVAGSALPVMAEEVVDETVEVEVVSDEVVDEAGDVVVDFTAEDTVVEDVLDDEEVVTEEAGDGPIYPSHTHDTANTAKFYDVDWTYGADGKLSKCTVFTQCQCEEYVSSFAITSFGSEVGNYKVTESTTGSGKDCEDKITYTYKLTDKTDATLAKTSSNTVAGDHDMDPLKVTLKKAATCTEDGTVEFFCKKENATVTLSGEKAKYYLDKMNNAWANNVVAGGHTYTAKASDLLWSKDCKSATLKLVCGTCKGEFVTNFTPVEEETKKETCTENGAHSYTIAKSLLTSNALTTLVKGGKDTKDTVTSTISEDQVKTLEWEKTVPVVDKIVEFKWNGLDSEKKPVGTSYVKFTCKSCKAATGAQGTHTVYINKKSNDTTCVLVANKLDNSTEPTCEKAGYYYYNLELTVGDAKYLSTEYDNRLPYAEKIINASAHSYAGKISNETAKYVADENKATCDREGSGLFYCEYCKTTNNETIPKLPHTLGEKKWKTKPTCTDDGTTTAYCSVCKKDIVETVKDSKGHVYGVKDSDVEWSADHKVVTVKFSCIDTDDHSATCALKTTPDKVVVTKIDKETIKPAGYKTTGIVRYSAVAEYKDSNGKVLATKTVTTGDVVEPATGKQETVTINIKDTTVVYDGNRHEVSAEASNSEAKVVVSYYKDEARTLKYSGAPYTAGTYYVKAEVKESEQFKAATANAVFVIKSAEPNVKVTPATKTVKNTKKNKINIKVTQNNLNGQSGKVEYKVVAKSGSDKIKVSKNGVVTVKKGAKKGTYTIKVIIKATPNKNYSGVKKEVKITVK